MAVKTQQTRLYYIDPATPTVATEAADITSINGISAGRDQIDTTTLAATSRTFLSGLASPGTATFGLNFDPASASHSALHTLYKNGTSVKWAVAWSDGSTVPTASAGSFAALPTRTLLTFDGFISDMSFDFSQNDVVKASASLQVSGFPTLLPKT